jgi:hypothetical protein
MVRVEVTCPDALGVTELGENKQLASTGKLAATQMSVTGWMNPEIVEIVSVIFAA